MKTRNTDPNMPRRAAFPTRDAWKKASARYKKMRDAKPTSPPQTVPGLYCERCGRSAQQLEDGNYLTRLNKGETPSRWGCADDCDLTRPEPIVPNARIVDMWKFEKASKPIRLTSWPDDGVITKDHIEQPKRPYFLWAIIVGLLVFILWYHLHMTAKVDESHKQFDELFESVHPKPAPEKKIDMRMIINAVVGETTNTF